MAADDLLVNAATNCPVKWTPSGGGTEVTLPNADWSINEDANVVMLVNGRDGVKRKKTFTDASADVTAYKDEVALVPGADISVGDVGTVKLYFTSTKYRSFTAIVGPIPDSGGSPGSAQTVGLQFLLESGVVTNGSD